MRQLMMAVVTAVCLGATAWGVTVECSTWAGVKSNLEAGNSVKLTGDVSFSGQGVWVDGSVAAEVTLDLNGHTVNGPDGSGLGGEHDRLFVLISSSGYKLTIVDSVGGGGFVGHQTGTYQGGFAYVRGGCQLAVENCTISGFSTTEHGGAITVSGNDAAFTMNGGTIKNCTSSRCGGAIYSESGARCTMNGGTVTDCSTSIDGGAIYCTGGVRFTMNGGTIKNCTATGNGGAVYANVDVQNAVRIAGGTIADCNANYGGAFYSAGKSGHIVTGGTFIENTANYGGTFATDATSWIDVMGGRFTKMHHTAQYPFYYASGKDRSCYLYGGVWEGYYPLSSKDDTTLSDGYSCVSVGSNYVIGKKVAYGAGLKLVTGTYTFCPTNAEYVAAGLSVASYATVTGSDMSYTIASAAAICDSWAQAKMNLEVGNNVKLDADVNIREFDQAVYVNGGVAAEVELDLNGHTVDGFLGVEERGVYYGEERDRVFLLNGSSVYKLTIVDSVGGGGFVGHANIWNHGGGFAYVGGSCQLVIDGCRISGFSTSGTGNGGAIMVDGQNATLAMNGCTITNCQSHLSGAVHCCNGGAMTLRNGTITGCSAQSGGAIGSSGGTVTLENMVLADNKATYGIGGAIYGVDGTYELKECVIRGNTAVSSGGALYVGSQCTTRVYGLVVGDNSPNDFGVDGAGSLTVYGGVYGFNPSSVANLAIASGYAATKVGSKWVVGKSVGYDLDNQLTGGIYTFCPTNAQYVADGLVVAPYATVTGSGISYAVAAPGSVIDCDSWVQAKGNLESGNSVKLVGDVSQGGEQSQLKLTSGGMNVTLDLNGHTVTCHSTSRLADVNAPSEEGATFTLKDSAGGGVVKNGSWENGSCVRVYEGNAFVMDGGKIYNCKGSGRGGAVYAQGTFTMNGGTIDSCANTGTGSDEGGGAVFASVSGTFTMNGGTISNCSASNEGGAVYCYIGHVTLRNGTISGCTAARGCGAVYFHSAWNWVVIENMTFTGNRALNGYGGAINFGNDGYRCLYELRNCTFTGNSATASGGALSIGKGCQVYIYDCTITGNTSGSGYGAIHLNGLADNSANVYGAVVSGNSPNNFNIEKANAFTVHGGVYGFNPSSVANLAIASGYAATKVGSKWVVGKSVGYDLDNQLTGGTYTFCPTNAAYVAGGVEVRKTVATVENATEPKTWTLFDTATEVLAVPTPVAHATALVYTNGFLSAEKAVGSGKWYVWFGKEATVVYTADNGYSFEDGATVVTNALDTMVSPAVNVGNPPKAVEAVVTTYVDERGAIRTVGAHVIVDSGSRVTWNAGWHVVTNAVTITGGADCLGAVKLILADGAKLTIEGVGFKNPGIGVTGDSNSFVVYGQTGGTGALQVSSGDYAAGIGGGSGCGGSNITINGGTVTATGGFCGAGIGGGSGGGGAYITINGGTVTANGGGKYAAGIGGGDGCSGSNITINGGTVTAKGANQGAGIGGGYHGGGSDILINGGTVTVTGGYSSAGIGGGDFGTGSNIRINGGTVTVTGGEYADCIGSGLLGARSSAIYVADNVILRAGDSENSATAIPHAGVTTDLAASLRDKRYATTAPVTYPGYLAKYDQSMKVKFDIWATTFGSCDPDGVYKKAFLLNVATNREEEAVKSFLVGSIAVTNGVVDVEFPQPLAPSTSFNGTVWLQCATNGLDVAEWLDVEGGRYIDEKGSLLRCLIDFEHTLTPDAFPTEPTGTKTIKVLVR